jgi:carbamoyl-phosphate synthase large subunit
MRLKILVTSVGGGLAPQFLRYFKKIKKHDIIIYGVDVNKNSISKQFLDFFQKTGRGNTKQFLLDVKKIVRKNKINIIIPGSDEDALNLSKNRKYIENKITQLASVDYNILKILSNKEKTYKFLNKNNIAAPEFFVVRNKKNLINRIKEIYTKHQIAVIKPSISRGGRNVFVIKKKYKSSNIVIRNSGREIELGFNFFLKKYLHKINFFPIIVMEYLKPPCYDFDMVCKDGVLINGITRKRINSSVPNEGHLVEHNEKIFNIGRKVVKALNLTWLYDCDLMIDNKNRPKIIEINPRMSGSASISIEAGVPIIENLINIYLNKKLIRKNIYTKIKIIPSIGLYKSEIK